MSSRFAAFVVAGTVACAAASSACFAVTDLDRFNQAPASTSNFSSFHMTVRGFVDHVAERVEVRVIDSQDVIQARAILVPLGGPNETFLLSNAVPKQNGPFHIDFYADHDNSGGYDPNPPRPDVVFFDHSWRLPLTDAMLDDSDTYQLVFDHNTSFTALDVPKPASEFGAPVTVHLVNMGPFAGRRVEVRIADASTKHTTAMYRNPALGGDHLDATATGMVEAGVTYTVEVYSDDGKGGAIKAFRFQSTAAQAGLEATFDGTNPASPAAPATPAPAVTDVAAAPTL